MCGSFTSAGSARTAPGQQSQAAQLRRFLAGVVQRVQAEANSEERDAALQRIEQRCAQGLLVERANQRAEVSHARQDQHFGVADGSRSVGAARFGAEFLQRALHRREVAGAVIDERDFHSSPFVLGRTCFSRLSRDTANRSARANALNMAST